MAIHDRIRDATVAEAVAAAAGVDATPQLFLSNEVHGVVQLQPRPPLAISGYFPGTMGVAVGGVALNTSHAGLFISGFGGAIGRCNWTLLENNTAGDLVFSLRRVDAPFTGFPSVRLVPGYINAGAQVSGRAFSVTKSDTVAAVGASFGSFVVEGSETLQLAGPWIINDGILVWTCDTVNTGFRVGFGYEVWPAFRSQRPG